MAIDVSELVASSAVSSDDKLLSSIKRDLGNNRYQPNDRSLAQMMQDYHSGQYAFTSGKGWGYWGGTRWKFVVDDIIRNETGAFLEKVRRVLPDAIDDEDYLKTWKGKLNNSGALQNGVSNVLRGMVALTDEPWDWQVDSLPCANGVVNLRTGMLEAHKPVNYNTGHTSVNYDPDVGYEEWEEFIRGCVTDGYPDDEDIYRYVWKSMGYSCTGRTVDERMYWVWGAPRAGKGVIISVLQELLGYMAISMPWQTISAVRGGNDQGFDLVRLQGARLVFVDETPRNQYLNAEEVKRLTGGSRIQASQKGKDITEIDVRAKFWVMSNNPWEASGDDDALWNSRMSLVRMPKSHMGKEDSSLKHRFTEPRFLTGVLNWVIKGAQMWYEEHYDQKHVMPEPTTLINMRNGLRTMNDTLGQWMEAHVEFSDDAWTKSDDIAESYREFLGDTATKRTNASVIKQLVARLPDGKINRTRRRLPDGTRVYGYEGIAIVAGADDDKEIPTVNLNELTDEPFQGKLTL